MKVLEKNVDLDEFKSMLRDRTTSALAEIEQIGYHDSHTSSTFMDFMMSDCEQMCHAIERHLKHRNSSTYTDLYTCLNTMCDRIELEVAKLMPMAGHGLVSLRYLQNVLNKMRSHFIQENKGIDLAGGRVTSRIGVPHRRNSLLKLGKQRIFERGIIEERD